MVPETPPEWLEHLAEQLHKRRPELIRLRDYATGNAPLPVGATQHRDAYTAFQRKARTNFPALIVDATADRMRISGFRVEGETGDNDAARALWRRSRMGAGSNDIHRDMLTFGVGYGMASPAASGALLTRESPLNTITDHDPLDPTTPRAALKTWVDHGTAWAVLHLPGRVFTFSRDEPTPGLSLTRPGVSWRLESEASSNLPVVPVVQFANRDFVGEFSEHTDLLDRINWTILQRLIIIAMQSFRQRGIKGDLPTVDETGKEIDYAQLFQPGPDALWMLPEGVDIWESQPGNIDQILSAVKDDLRDLSAVTRTPMSVLSPDSANQSAEGAAFAREGLVFKSEDRVARALPSWDAYMSLGLLIDGLDVEVETQFAPCDRQSLAERADAFVKLTSGDSRLPWRRAMTDVLGYDAATVDQMETERSADALSLLMAGSTMQADVAAQ